MDRTIENKLSDLYLSNLDIIGDGFPDVVNTARRESMEAFMLEGLPSATDEDYRHTDIKGLFSGEMEYYFTPAAGTMPSGTTLPIEGHTVNLHNGFLADSRNGSGLRTTAQGVVIGSLREALQQSEPHAIECYNNAAKDSQALTSLNSAFMQDGAFVYIPDGVKLNVPVVINIALGGDDPARLCFTRILIIAGAGAQANILVNFSQTAISECRFVVNHVTETILGDGADINMSEVSSLGSGSTLIAGSYCRQQASSTCKNQSLWFGGRHVRVNAAAEIDGQEASYTLNSLFIGENGRSCDSNVLVRHNVPKCHSSQLVKSVVSGDTYGAYTGRIFVAQDAQQTEAFQLSRAILLSDGAKQYTEPQLEIYADDVKCSHGATIGQMDDEAVYYMRQRGLSEKDARRLQLAGFINDVVERCADPDFCRYASALAEEAIAKL